MEKQNRKPLNVAQFRSILKFIAVMFAVAFTLMGIFFSAWSDSLSNGDPIMWWEWVFFTIFWLVLFALFAIVERNIPTSGPRSLRNWKEAFPSESIKRHEDAGTKGIDELGNEYKGFAVYGLWLSLFSFGWSSFLSNVGDGLNNAVITSLLFALLGTLLLLIEFFKWNKQRGKKSIK